MILGDLLGAAVYDADGTRLGRVADARFVVDGGPHQLMAGARLLGLVVRRRSSDTNGRESPSRGPWQLCSDGGTEDHSLSCGPTSAKSARSPSGSGKDSPPTARPWIWQARRGRPQARSPGAPRR
jgi:hypothetical protein